MDIVWNSSVYAQERNILTVSNYDANTVKIQVVSTNPSGITASYVLPAGRVAMQVDLTDLVRMTKGRGLSGGTFRVVELDSTGTEISSYGKNYSIIGRINPLTYYNALPSDEILDAFRLAISAPSVMYKRLDNVADQITFELAAGYDTYPFTTGRIKFPPTEGAAISFANMVQVPNDASGVEFWHLDEERIIVYGLKELECGKRYAEVEWESFTGRTRRHVFEVVKLTEEEINDVELEMINNEYDVRKGKRISFALRLEDLTAYDYWYYSDLITSSNVKVALRGTDYKRVQVTEKKSVIPESNECGLFTLEIPINFVRYDTF